MFFDIILLKPHHKSQFGNAWLAATRGENVIPKSELLEIDICKLCDDLKDFIISESSSPKKRFSLRLSSMLINGTIKILKKQVMMLEVQVVRVLQYLDISDDELSFPLQQQQKRRIHESPLTPIAVIKQKKGRKHLKVSSTRELEEIETAKIQLEEPLNLPDVENVLNSLQRSDLFQLRDEGPKQREETGEDDFRFEGPLTEKEIQDFGLGTAFTSSHLPVRPATSSSSDPIFTTHIIETVVQVHKEGDGSPPSKRLRKESEVPDQEGPAEEARPASRDAVEPFAEAVAPPVEDVLPAPLIEETVSAHLIEETVPAPIIEQLSEIVPLLTQQTRETTEEIPNVAYITQARRRRAVKINIDMNEEMENLQIFALDETRYHLDMELNDLETLFRELWLPLTAAESIQNGSMDSSTLGRKSASRKRDRTKPKLLKTPPRTSDQNLSGKIREPSPLSAGTPRGSPLIIAPGEISPPINDEVTPRSSPLQRDIPEIEVAREPIEVEDISEIREQPLVSEVPVLQHLQEETPQIYVQINETEESVPTVPAQSWDILGFTQRQLNIINIVKKCDDQQALSIEDVTEKPIKRLTIARAFSDLLVLTGMKYLNLENEEDSIELKSIKKGPKLLQTEK